jgi:hypothetical protein
MYLEYPARKYYFYLEISGKGEMSSSPVTVFFNKDEPDVTTD